MNPAQRAPDEPDVSDAGHINVPNTDAAIILSVTVLLVAFILVFLFQSPGFLGSGLAGE